MRKIQVWSLGQEDSLKKEMATHSSTLAYFLAAFIKLGTQGIKNTYILQLLHSKIHIRGKT